MDVSVRVSVWTHVFISLGCARERLVPGPVETRRLMQTGFHFLLLPAKHEDSDRLRPHPTRSCPSS